MGEVGLVNTLHEGTPDDGEIRVLRDRGDLLGVAQAEAHRQGQVAGRADAVEECQGRVVEGGLAAGDPHATDGVEKTTTGLGGPLDTFVGARRSDEEDRSEAVFDCFLLVGRYTLIDHSALPEFLPLCPEKNISVIIGAPHTRGILASDLSEASNFSHLPVQPEVVERAGRYNAVCDRYAFP